MTPGDFPKNQCVKLENISHVTCNDIHSLQLSFEYNIQYFGLDVLENEKQIGKKTALLSKLKAICKNSGTFDKNNF